MKIHIAPLAWLLVTVALLTGCSGSPVSNYYVLTPHESAPATGQSPALGIGPIAIPQYLNRTGMVFMQEGNQLQIARADRWAEPLEEGINRVLGLNLSSLLDTENIRYFPWNPQRAPDYGVKVTVLSMDAGASEVRLVAEWLVHRPDTDETVSRRISQLRYTLPPGELTPARLAPAYSALFYQLSEIIAAAISAGENNGSAPADS